MNRQPIKLAFFCFLFCIFACISCLPRTESNKEVAENTTNNRGARRTAQASSAGNTQSNTSGRKTRASSTPKAEGQVLNTDSLNIARLAALAVSQQAVKPSARRNTAESNPFDKRKELLKDVNSESERFIDTTYYMLKMEDGAIEVVSDVATAGKKTQEDYENLIRAFIKASEEAEKSAMYDCNVFKIYEGQFAFNDSLMQEAKFSLAECLLSNDNIAEAINVLEEMCDTKMNKGVAPKALVRLGQAYCITGDNAKAKRYFNRLKKEFPRSVYNQLADCGRL